MPVMGPVAREGAHGGADAVRKIDPDLWTLTKRPVDYRPVLRRRPREAGNGMLSALQTR